MFVVAIGILRMLGAVVMNGRLGRGVFPVKSCCAGCGRLLGAGRRGDGGVRLRTR